MVYDTHQCTAVLSMMKCILYCRKQPFFATYVIELCPVQHIPVLVCRGNRENQFYRFIAGARLVLPVMAANRTWTSHLSKSTTSCLRVLTPAASMKLIGAQSITTVWILYREVQGYKYCTIRK